MLSFKKGHELLDFYVETDLDDTIDDDQPIDFCKRYSHQDHYSRDASKKRPLSSTPSVQSDPQGCKHPCNDEMKVYCIEGTPLLISSASSMCDLRELMTAAENTRQYSADIIEAHKSLENPSTSNAAEYSKIIQEKNSSTKQDEDVPITDFPVSDSKSNSFDDQSPIFKSEANVSRASSPLMFSRSSSIGSLNSFEQSVRDDRSSVSAFSALTSGIISPSEIPDSPGEAMSPFYQKNKNTQFPFPNISSEKTAGTVSDLAKDVCADLSANKSFDSLPDDDVKVFNDEGDFSSVSSFSSLSIQTSSNCGKSPLCLQNTTNIRVKTSLRVVTTTRESTVKEIDVPNFSAVPEQKQEEEANINQDMSNFSDGFSSRLSPLSFNESLSDHNGNGNTEMPKCVEDQKLCVKLEDKLPSSNVSSNYFRNFEKCEQQISFDDTKDKKSSFSRENETTKFTILSEESSDGEADELLNECIRNGMPNRNLNTSYKTTLAYPLSSSPVSKGLKNSAESDLESDDDDLLKQCIQLGMPSEKKKVEPPQFPSRTSATPFQDERNKNCESDSDDEDDDLLKQCIRLGMPTIRQKEEPKNSFVPNCVTTPSFNVNHNKAMASHKIENVKSAGSRKSAAMLTYHSYQQRPSPSTFRNTVASNSFVVGTSYDKELGYRDNRPDGISDGEDDDDALLTACINAGKSSYSTPAPRNTHNSPEKYKNSRLPQPSKAVQDSRSLQLRKYASLQSNQCLLSKPRCISPSAIIVPDSMCVYRTEDTPVLSPTASVSDLSILSFSEDKNCLNNSRNSDCSSESEDDELLLQCIRSGMPTAKRIVM